MGATGKIDTGAAAMTGKSGSRNPGAAWRSDGWGENSIRTQAPPAGSRSGGAVFGEEEFWPSGLLWHSQSHRPAASGLQQHPTIARPSGAKQRLPRPPPSAGTTQATRARADTTPRITGLIAPGRPCAVFMSMGRVTRSRPGPFRRALWSGCSGPRRRGWPGVLRAWTAGARDGSWKRLRSRTAAGPPAASAAAMKPARHAGFTAGGTPSREGARVHLRPGLGGWPSHARGELGHGLELHRPQFGPRVEVACYRWCPRSCLDCPASPGDRRHVDR